MCFLDIMNIDVILVGEGDVYSFLLCSQVSDKVRASTVFCPLDLVGYTILGLGVQFTDILDFISQYLKYCFFFFKYIRFVPIEIRCIAS